jgi:hypothetical protein
VETISIQWICDGRRSVRHDDIDSRTGHASRQYTLAICWLSGPVPVWVAPGKRSLSISIAGRASWKLVDGCYDVGIQNLL